MIKDVVEGSSDSQRNPFLDTEFLGNIQIGVGEVRPAECISALVGKPSRRHKRVRGEARRIDRGLATNARGMTVHLGEHVAGIILEHTRNIGVEHGEGETGPMEHIARDGPSGEQYIRSPIEDMPKRVVPELSQT